MFCSWNAKATLMVPATATPGLRKRHLRGKTENTQKNPEAEDEDIWKTIENPSIFLDVSILISISEIFFPPKSHFQVKWCFQIKLVFSNKRVCKRGGAGRTRKKCLFSNINIRKLTQKQVLWTGASTSVAGVTLRKESMSRAVRKCHHIRPMTCGWHVRVCFCCCLVVKKVFIFTPCFCGSTHVFIFYLLWYVYVQASFFGFSESKLASEPSRWIC